MYALGVVVWTIAIIVSTLAMVAWWLEAEINMSPLGRRLWYWIALPLFLIVAVVSGIFVF